MLWYESGQFIMYATLTMDETTGSVSHGLEGPMALQAKIRFMTIGPCTALSIAHANKLQLFHKEN